MTLYQRKLSEEDLKKIEEHDGDVYCMFSESHRLWVTAYMERRSWIFTAKSFFAIQWAIVAIER